MKFIASTSAEAPMALDELNTSVGEFVKVTHNALIMIRPATSLKLLKFIPSQGLTIAVKSDIHTGYPIGNDKVLASVPLLLCKLLLAVVKTLATFLTPSK